MSYRLAFALASMLAATNSFASIVTLPSAIIICPDSNYVEALDDQHVNNFGLAVEPGFGYTPAGNGDPNKCGITPIRGATPVCPAGWQSHFAYDVFDYEWDWTAPITRTFREELHINSFNGIPSGGRLKFAELQFSSGENVSFYFDRIYSWRQDMTVIYSDGAGSEHVEVSRFNFPVGLPLTQAVPLKIVWTTGRHGTHREVYWTIADTAPFNPSNEGWIELTPDAYESRFSNGIVDGSCAGSASTQIRFIQPRFTPY